MRRWFLKLYPLFSRFFFLSQALLFLLPCKRKEEARDLSLFLDSDSINFALRTDLLRASNCVYAELFRLTDPLIVRTLQQKKASGLSIKLFLDAQCKILPQVKKLDLIGAAIQYDRASGLMHRKVIVIDNRQSWIGSFNITRTGFYLQKNAFLRIENEEVACFLQQAKEKTKSFQIGLSTLQIWKIPPAREALNCLRSSIQKAKFSIRAALFVCSHPQIIEDLIAAHQRGVSVELILDQGQSQGSPQKAILRLYRAGIQPALFKGNQDLHHKFAWIDEEIVLSGSCNWSKNGFSKNRELLFKLITQEPHLIQKIRKLWTNCASNAFAIR
ncbi:phospholipase D-like domain-containing protein [Candidatus Similichlamydia laticola]|uniref:phospholipase D n=1 Tax=Candidatus Similichlamydia laticola TaxID=2170265 RepID=A0A369KA10_9BACT|nr:phospholipase D-like domain-containing protein [Candidatus Similichlamydia laticola]RDB31431.1 Phospholipase D endonuclease superfamily [Candidatus Similichlamydia laticola]